MGDAGPSRQITTIASKRDLHSSRRSSHQRHLETIVRPVGRQTSTIKTSLTTSTHRKMILYRIISKFTIYLNCFTCNLRLDFKKTKVKHHRAGAFEPSCRSQSQHTECSCRRALPGSVTQLARHRGICQGHPH